MTYSIVYLNVLMGVDSIYFLGMTCGPWTWVHWVRIGSVWYAVFCFSVIRGVIWPWLDWVIGSEKENRERSTSEGKEGGGWVRGLETSRDLKKKQAKRKMRVIILIIVIHYNDINNWWKTTWHDKFCCPTSQNLFPLLRNKIYPPIKYSKNKMPPHMSLLQPRRISPRECYVL